MKKTNLFLRISKKLIVVLAVVVGAVMVVNNKPTLSKEVVVKNVSEKDIDYLTKKKAMYTVLKRYNSPLASEVDAFITVCKKYDLDCYLLPSIAGIESYFGQALLPHTYNPFGWGGGRIVFSSWEDGFDKVGYGLRNNYIDKGADTIEKIGYIYCPPNNTWSQKVRFFMNKFIEAEEELSSPVVTRS